MCHYFVYMYGYYAASYVLFTHLVSIRDIPMAQFAMTAANIGTLLGGVCGVS